MRHLPLFLMTILFVATTCNNRSGPVSPRNNIYDSGSGDHYLVDGIPLIAGSADTIWYDFNHKTGRGAIKIFYIADDPNFPHDTITCQLFGENAAASTEPTSQKIDSFFILDNLPVSSHGLCTLSVSDRFDSSATNEVYYNAPLLLPPTAPKPELNSENNPITIIWKSVPAATKYVIYGSPSFDGPFSVDSMISQPAKGPNISVTYSYRLKNGESRFFIIASKNGAGESRSTDTLFAQLYSESAPVPTIDLVSKGTYPDYILISWSPSEGNPKAYDLYRSASSDKGFVKVTTVSNGTSYNDSVKNPEVYHYRLSAVQKDGSASFLSEPDSGFLEQKNFPLIIPIQLTVIPGKGGVSLTWAPIEAVNEYAVYRSAVSCKTDIARIYTTKYFEFFDSASTAATYYYSVIGLTKEQKTIAESECKPGTTSILPQPQGIRIVNASTHSIISWDPLTGAESYIIYRSLTECPNAKNELITIKSTYYKDTSMVANTRYYRVAAVDNSKRKGTLSNCYIGSIKQLSSPLNFTVSNGEYPSTIHLSWSSVAGGVSYVIYRSDVSCSNLTKLASTTILTYVDSVSDTKTYHYTVAAVDESGTEGSASDCKSGRIRALEAPTNPVASYNEYPNGININWNQVKNASGYIIYRGVTISLADMSVVAKTTSTTYFDTGMDAQIYFYRIAAFDSNGEGEPSNYTTGKKVAPPELTLYSQPEGSMYLTWYYSSSSTIAYIYRSTDNSPFTVIDSTTNTSYYDDPTTSGILSYRVDVKTSKGTIIPSNVVSGSKALPPPDSLKAVDGSDYVYLIWPEVPGATSYVIYRDTYSNGTSLLTEVSNTWYQDYTVTVKGRYYYRVAAKNSNSLSYPSMSVIAGLLQTPSAPWIDPYGDVDGIIVTCGFDNEYSTPEGYVIYRKDKKSGKFLLLDSVKVDQEYFDSVPDYESYTYKATAYNSNGTSSFSEEVSASRMPPNPPYNVAASNAISAKYIKLSWSSADRVTGYNIYRRNPQTVTYEKIGTTLDTVFFDTTVGDNYNYIYYYITSYKGTVESSSSDYFNGTLFGPPATIYANPTIKGISVSWTSRLNTTKYYVYRSGTLDGAYPLIDSSITNSYIDSNELAGTNFYKVAAYSSTLGEKSVLSKASTGATRTYPTAPSTVSATIATDSAVVKVSWSVSNGATQYLVYRSTSDTFLVNVKLIKTIDTTVFLDTVPSDSVYFYKVKAANKGGESSLSTSLGRGYRIPKKVPATPISFDTLSSTSSVELKWTMPSQTIAYTGFRVYRSESAEGTYAAIATINNFRTNQYSDRPPSSFPSVYWYKVSTVNQAGESVLSAAVSGTRR